MTKMQLGAALEAVSVRNAALVTAYREGSRRVLSRSVVSLALSMADQRRELGKELAAIAEFPGIEGAEAELDFDPSGLEPPHTWEPGEAPVLLERMRRSESEDFELLAGLAGAFLPLSAEAAERLAALAEQARKRASWAQDHLDLLGMA